MQGSDSVTLEGLHCVLTVERLAPGVVRIVFSGTDVGELGDAPFRELDARVAGPSPLDLFIDARAARAASVEVSGDWARWMRSRRADLGRVHMLTATRFVELSADLVRRFAGLEGAMRVYTDPAAFEEALAESVRAARG